MTNRPRSPVLALLLLWLVLAGGPLAQALQVADLGLSDDAPAATHAPATQDAPAQAVPAAPAAVRGAPADSDASPAAAPRGDADAASSPSGIRVGYAEPPRSMGPGDSQDMTFVCPEPDPVQYALGPANGDPVIYGCPIRIYDAGFALGHPALAVYEEDHLQVAFSSLHGGASTNGPYGRSRAGQTHTVFPSGDQGLTWDDVPTSVGASSGEFSSSGLGSDNDIAMDSAGNLYLAYLSDAPVGGDVFESGFGLYKAPPAAEGTGVSRAYDGEVVVYGRDLDNTITRIHLERLPAHVPLLEVEEEFNETAEPTTEDQNGEAALVPDYANATEERVVAVWHERAYDHRNSTTGLSAWVDVAWTDVGPNNTWMRIAKEEVIGPCRDASNAVAYEGKLYVACVVDRGYKDRPRARVGDVDLWSIDVHEGTTALVSSTGLEGGHPLLAIAEDGYMGLVSYTKMRDDGGNLTHLQVETAFSWYGHDWERGGDLGPELRRWGGGPNMPLLDADVTAYTMTTEEHTSLLVYKEWHDDPQEPEGADPEDPTAPITNRLTDYNKYFVSFNQCDFPIAGYKAELGSGVDSFNADQYTTNPAVFNEVRDSLVVVREDGGTELVYFAIADYGAIQYGAVYALEAGSECFVGAPPLLPAPAAIPQALTVNAAASAAVGAAFAVPAVAMLGYLLTVKRRTPSYAAAEDK